VPTPEDTSTITPPLAAPPPVVTCAAAPTRVHAGALTLALTLTLTRAGYMQERVHTAPKKELCYATQCDAMLHSAMATPNVAPLTFAITLTLTLTLPGARARANLNPNPKPNPSPSPSPNPNPNPSPSPNPNPTRSACTRPRSG